MSTQMTGGRLASVFRPRGVAPAGASGKSAISALAYQNWGTAPADLDAAVTWASEEDR